MKFVVLLLVFINILLGFVVTEPQQLTANDFAAALNEFSYSFLKQCDFTKENVVFSPISISMAFGMLLEGARGTTAEQIYQLLNVNNYEDKEKVHKYLHESITEFKLNWGRKQGYRNISVEYANLMLISKNFNVNQSFIETLKVQYLASVGTEDFANDGQRIMEKINTFVKERTHNLISKILNEPVNPDTIMFLLNSIYFKGYWEKPFSKINTINSKFNNFDNTDSNVEYLTQEKLHRFLDDKEHNVKVIEMDYLGNASMIIILPKEKDGLKRIIENLSMKQLESIKNNAKQSHISVKIPKLKYEFSADLKQILPKMGLILPFTKPDLSGIAEGIKVSESKHKAMIAVDEAGTEAAAVTTIEVVPESLFVGPEFFANHPFVYFIRDKQSGVNLFVGVVNKMKSV